MTDPKDKKKKKPEKDIAIHKTKFVTKRGRLKSYPNSWKFLTFQQD